MMAEKITYEDFTKVDIRTGTILQVDDFPEARKPAYKLKVDFGELGILKSSAQITALYTKDELLEKQVMAVVSFEPKQIGTFMSECLVLGVYNSEQKVVLLSSDIKVENGSKIC